MDFVVELGIGFLCFCLFSIGLAWQWKVSKSDFAAVGDFFPYPLGIFKSQAFFWIIWGGAFVLAFLQFIYGIEDDHVFSFFGGLGAALFLLGRSRSLAWAGRFTPQLAFALLLPLLVYIGLYAYIDWVEDGGRRTGRLVYRLVWKGGVMGSKLDMAVPLLWFSASFTLMYFWMLRRRGIFTWANRSRFPTRLFVPVAIFIVALICLVSAMTFFVLSGIESKSVDALGKTGLKNSWSGQEAFLCWDLSSS
jgi:hypothetical protein